MYYNRILDQKYKYPKNESRTLVVVGAKESMPWLSGPWQRKVKSPLRLGLGTILSLLGQSLTYMGQHTILWVWSLGMAWEDVRYPRSPSLWASLHYVLLGHI